jgi:hypothetical protein
MHKDITKAGTSAFQYRFPLFPAQGSALERALELGSMFVIRKT